MEPSYSYKLEYITPEIAAKLLATAGVNRIVSMLGVKRIAAALTENRWDNNAPGLVVLDTNGQLRDGQHRCHAAVRSGVGFWAILVQDMPPESFAVLDTGRRRSASAVLAMEGVKYAAASASASRYAMNYIEGTGLRAARDNDEVRAFFHRNPIISTLAQKAFPAGRKFGISPFTAIMFLASHERTLHKKIDKFIAGVAGSADETYAAGDPRLLLRTWAEREFERGKGHVIRPEPLMMATALAWNAYALGKPVSHPRELTRKEMAHRSTMPVVGYDPQVVEFEDDAAAA